MLSAVTHSDPKPSQDAAWTRQPPYRRPDEPTDDHQPFNKRIQGSCHCGRVALWLSSQDALDVKLCHCNTCKLIHGAPCQWVAVVAKPDMAFEHGTQDLRFYHAPTRSAEHVLPCKVSCAYCGTLIMDEGRHMALLFPPVLGQSSRDLDVRCHIFYSERVVDIPDGKPKWETVDGQGEPLDLP